MAELKTPALVGVLRQRDIVKGDCRLDEPPKQGKKKFTMYVLTVSKQTEGT